jgi:hypothetical protein
MREKRLIDSFTNCIQGDGESLAEYYFRFNNSIKDITLAKLTLPSDAMQALRFIENLSDKQYIEFKTNSRNFVNLGITYPNTLSKAIAKVSEYHPSSRINYNQPIAAVANAAKIRHTKRHCTHCQRDNHEVGECRVKAREERRARRSKKFCTYCRKEGHTIEECHTKARDDIESASEDSDDKPEQAPNPSVNHLTVGWEEDHIVESFRDFDL